MLLDFSICSLFTFKGDKLTNLQLQTAVMLPRREHYGASPNQTLGQFLETICYTVKRN